MSGDVEASLEGSLSNERECHTWKKRNIPKILFCGHVIWICQKCLSTQNCCPECQSPLIDPQMTDNGGGKILQENLFTDLFQEEEFDNGLILHEPSSWRNLHPEGNMPSVSSCRLCNNHSDRREPHHLLHRPESIRRCLDNRNSSLCCIHDRDSTDFCSTHRLPICLHCKYFHTKCTVKPISEELKEMTQMLSSKYAELEERESFFIKEQLSAEKRLEKDKERIHNEFKKIVMSIRERKKELEKCLEEKYSKKKEDLDRKLRRVIEHKSLMKRAMTSAPTPAFFNMTRTLQVICNNVVSDTPYDVTLELCQDDIRSVIEAIKHLGKLFEKDFLHFDNKYGENIQLSENNTRAQRLQRSKNGIVLSSQPMEYDKLYQVEVLEYDAGQQGTMRIGVCWKGAELALPTTSATLPTMLESFSLIGEKQIWKVGEKVGTSCAYGKKLNDVRERSIVGIAMRSLDCRIHLYIDGVDCGPSPFIFDKERYIPLFAVFVVESKVNKIRALPLKKVSTYSPTLPCGHTSCKSCNQINSACSINGPRGGLNLTSTGFSCHSKNVVYVVTCNKCNILYVGKTGGIIQKRCTSHRNNVESSVYEHVSKCGSEFSIAGVFKDLQDDYERKVIETTLMLKLGTLQPKGLNKSVSVKRI